MKKFSKIFRKKMLSKFFFLQFFFYGRGASPSPHPPPGLHPWSSFGLRTLHSGNRFALNGISAKNLNIFFNDIFFYQLKKKILKIVWIVPKKIFIEIGRINCFQRRSLTRKEPMPGNRIFSFWYKIICQNYFMKGWIKYHKLNQLREIKYWSLWVLKIV